MALYEIFLNILNILVNIWINILSLSNYDIYLSFSIQDKWNSRNFVSRWILYDIVDPIFKRISNIYYSS